MKTQIRMSDELHEMIARAAEQNSRSMNAELVVRLRDSFAPAPPDLDSQLADIRSRLERLEKVTCPK